MKEVSNVHAFMMYRSIYENEIDIFNSPARIIVSGTSGAGKSFFISKLIRKYRNKFDNVIVVGAEFENIEDLHVTRNDNYNPLTDGVDGKTLIVYDDIIYNKEKLTTCAEVFIRGRHLGLNTILITQNLFLSDKNYRIISLNCTHVAIFRNRDIKQVCYFARSFLQNSLINIFVNLYKKVVMNTKHGYLLIDFNKNVDNPLFIRSSVVDDGYEKAYKIDE